MCVLNYDSMGSWLFLLPAGPQAANAAEEVLCVPLALATLLTKWSDYGAKCGTILASTLLRLHCN